MINPIGKIPSKKTREEYSAKTKYFHNKFNNINKLPLMVAKRSRKASDRKPNQALPVLKQNAIPCAKDGELKFYWLGHSSILVQMGPINILADPIFSKYASPLTHIGVKRFSAIPIDPENLPQIDILLISHDHYDHLDHKTLFKIKDKVKHIIVPLGVECILTGWGFDAQSVTALNWWEKTTIGGITITATPAQHFSGRNPIFGDLTWWCGFCFQNKDHTIYYSGDGGYSDSFKEIGQKFDIDLAFLECGQYDEAWPNCHMFPEQTALAAADLQAKYCIPVHWGAYCLCNSSWNDSPKRFTKEADRLGLNYITPIIGDCITYTSIGRSQTNWWR